MTALELLLSQATGVEPEKLRKYLDFMETAGALPSADIHFYSGDGAVAVVIDLAAGPPGTPPAPVDAPAASSVGAAILSAVEGDGVPTAQVETPKPTTQFVRWDEEDDLNAQRRLCNAASLALGDTPVDQEIARINALPAADRYTPLCDERIVKGLFAGLKPGDIGVELDLSPQAVGVRFKALAGDVGVDLRARERLVEALEQRVEAFEAEGAE